MTNIDAAELLNREFYGGLYKRFGLSHRSLDIGARTSQTLRFDALFHLLSPPKAEEFSILDVGCGFGDFHRYLWERGCRPNYVGIDVTPEIIKAASRRDPELDLRCGDFLATSIDERFDYIVCSGTLNLKLPDSPDWIEQVVRKMITCADLAVGFNMTSIYTAPEYRQERTYYADPAQMFTFCKTLVEAVALRHDYMPNDFAIGLYKRGFAGERTP